MYGMCEYRLVIGRDDSTGEGQVDVVAPQGLTIHTEPINTSDPEPLPNAIGRAGTVIASDIDSWGCEGYA